MELDLGLGCIFTTSVGDGGGQGGWRTAARQGVFKGEGYQFQLRRALRGVAHFEPAHGCLRTRRIAGPQPQGDHPPVPAGGADQVEVVGVVPAVGYHREGEALQAGFRLGGKEERGGGTPIHRHAQRDVVLLVRRNCQRRAEGDAVRLGKNHFQTSWLSGHAGIAEALPTLRTSGEIEGRHCGGRLRREFAEADEIHFKLRLVIDIKAQALNLPFRVPERQNRVGVPLIVAGHLKAGAFVLSDPGSGVAPENLRLAAVIGFQPDFDLLAGRGGHREERLQLENGVRTNRTTREGTVGDGNVSEIAVGLPALQVAGLVKRPLGERGCAKGSW